jgi:hypothetical protein
MADGSISAVHTDGPGARTLLAGILLVIPGFITDAAGLLLLLRGFAATLRRGPPRPSADGVVDLAPDQWERIPDPALPDRRDHGGG